MKRILVGISFFMVFSLQAQDGNVVLSLSDCIEIGLERNYTLRIVRNQEQIATNNRSIGNAGFLPVLDLTGRYDGSLSDTRSETFEGEINKADGVYNDVVNAGLYLSWTLFDGLKMQANYEKFKELQRMGELQIRLTVEDLVARIATEYNNHIYQLLRLKNLEFAVELSRERVRIEEARYQTGAASMLDVNQARVDLNTDFSRYISQKEIINVSIINLNRLLANVEVTTPFFLADTTIVIEPLTDFEILREKTLEWNTDILLAARNKRLSELDVKVIRSRYFPYLNFNANYGYGLNRYETGLNKETQSLNFNYGLTLGINLFEGFNTRREMRNARIEIENKELLQSDLQLNILATLSNLYLSYRNNMELYRMEEENLRVARDYYEAAADRYMLGSLSGLDFRDAQQNLLDAEERLLLAKYSVKLCEISLKQLSGDINNYIEL